jgi:hypothetical protein
VRQYIATGYCNWTGHDGEGKQVSGDGAFQVTFWAMSHDEEFVREGAVMAVQYDGDRHINGVPVGITDIQITSFVFWSTKAAS